MRPGLAFIGAVAVGSLALAQPAADARAEVAAYLTKVKFSAAEIAQLEGGQVVAHADTGQNDREMIAVAAVKIRAPRDRVVNYYGQMISYVDGQVTLAFGRFSTPPVLADVKDLSLSRDEVNDLKSCKVGDCDLRFGGSALEAIKSSVNWNAVDAADQVNVAARQAAVKYVAAYQTKGDAALVTYNDRDQPVVLADEWRGLLAASPYFHEYAPELAAHLERFPGDSLPGARDLLYWVKENYGMKPVISIVHGVIYAPPSRSDRTIVAQKYIYASHYYDASLAVATLLDTTVNGAPGTYLVYANRSRGDLLQGGFGGLKRATARSQARKAAETTLTTIKQVMEGAGS
ncbi:MAG TPA: hypothetical protein VLT86_07290 [Vicinamibacterales bacterium]|nr:hypothetical protein [Vicinamibacterales bacterium]